MREGTSPRPLPAAVNSPYQPREGVDESAQSALPKLKKLQKYSQIHGEKELYKLQSSGSKIDKYPPYPTQKCLLCGGMDTSFRVFTGSRLAKATQKRLSVIAAAAKTRKCSQWAKNNRSDFDEFAALIVLSASLSLLFSALRLYSFVFLCTLHSVLCTAFPYILNTPYRVSSLGWLRQALRASPRTRRVSAGSRMPSSHSRAVE
jgi:hypothetical protein